MAKINYKKVVYCLGVFAAYSMASFIIAYGVLTVAQLASYFGPSIVKSVDSSLSSAFDFKNDTPYASMAAISAVPDSSSLEESSSSEISMLFVGDIMLDRGVEYSVLNNGGDLSFLFDNLQFLKESDIVFGNLEGSISSKGKDLGGLYSFRFETYSVFVLKRAGFNVVSVANNHAGDWGRESFEDSLRLLDRRDIATVGGGFDREDAEHVKIIEKEGIKIGFVGFSDVGPRWMEADDDLSGILLVDDDFEDIIKRGASQVDYLVVSLHFGNEYEAEASERQKKLARLAIDAGAKIIVGHHPHVIQEVERYKDGVIAYSLGNFIFDQNFSEETMKGLILKISANEDKITNVETIATKLNENFQPELITP